MSNAPVCHISTGSTPIQQPRPTLLPTIPVAVDLPSAIAAINQLKLLIQMLAGQTSVFGQGGFGAGGGSTAAGSKGQKGKDGTKARFQEDRSQRVTKKTRIFQNNDKKSDNWVDIKQINRVVWVDNTTGETIIWSR